MRPIAATISVDANDFEVGRLFQINGIRHVEPTLCVPVGEHPLPYVRIKSEDLAQVEKALRSDHRIRRLESLYTGSSVAEYFIEWGLPLNDLIGVLRSHGLFVEQVRGTPTRWEFRLRASDRQTFADSFDECRKQGCPFQIHQMASYDPDSASLGYGLTPKQREALQLAYKHGYFETPRQTTLSELGDELGITHQAMTKRFSKGVEKLIEASLLDVSI